MATIPQMAAPSYQQQTQSMQSNPAYQKWQQSQAMSRLNSSTPMTAVPPQLGTPMARTQPAMSAAPTPVGVKAPSVSPMSQTQIAPKPAPASAQASPKAQQMRRQMPAQAQGQNRQAAYQRAMSTMK